MSIDGREGSVAASGSDSLSGSGTETREDGSFPAGSPTSEIPSVHVERTSSDRALRWIARRPDLAETPVPPPHCKLTGLINNEEIVGVSVDGGDLIVGFHNADQISDEPLVAEVHRAIIEALTMPGWSSGSTETGVSIRRARK